MEYGVRLNVNGTADLIEVPEDRDWRWYPQQLGCTCFEIVRPRGLPEPYILIVDEEGLLVDKPVLNFYASWLYETHKHGNPIVGTALILRDVMGEDGNEIAGMPKADAEILQAKAYEDFFIGSAEIEKALGDRLVKR